MRAIRWLAIMGLVPMLGAAMPSPTLTLSIDGLRSQRGMVRICLTQAAKHFPDCSRDAESRSLSVAATAAANIPIEQVPAGDYAVSVIHDENANSKLDTFIGIPREGIGFSRNPAVRFGAPSFRSARFTIDRPDTPVREQIHMRYFL